jgi:surface antigen
MMFNTRNFKQVLAGTAGLALMLSPGPVSAIGTTPTAPVAVSQAAPSVQSGAPRRGFLSGIFGCESSGGKQVTGAVIGGVAGGLLGNVIAGGGNRALGTILGGALGAAAGSAIGCKMQRNDQARAERAMEDAVATNKNQTWQGDESGASGKVEVSQASGGGLSDIKFAKNVEPASGFSKVGNSYVAAGSANIRSAPNTSASILGQLATGQRVWVPAQVSGQPWLLISDNGVGQGYVSANLLKRSTNSMAAKGCKMVKHTLSNPGEADSSETLQACKGADGQWVMTRV